MCNMFTIWSAFHATSITCGFLFSTIAWYWWTWNWLTTQFTGKLSHGVKEKTSAAVLIKMFTFSPKCPSRIITTCMQNQNFLNMCVCIYICLWYVCVRVCGRDWVSEKRAKWLEYQCGSMPSSVASVVINQGNKCKLSMFYMIRWEFGYLNLRHVTAGYCPAQGGFKGIHVCSS